MGKRIVFIICALLCGALIFLNEQAANAARQGYELWQCSVMPALLPFFICTGLMRKLELAGADEPAALMALSFVSGAPGGARLCSSIYGQDKGCTFCTASLNALSPMFAAGSFASSMLGCPQAAVPIIVGQFLAMLIFYIIALKLVPQKPTALRRNDNGKESLGVLFASCVAESAAALVSICGMIIFFSVLIRILEQTNILALAVLPFKRLFVLLGGNENAPEAIICAMLEAASGAKKIAHAGLKIREATAAGTFAFSFGGLCIMAQSMLFVRLDIKKYVLFKLAQGALAAAIAYLLFPLCCAGVQSVAAQANALDALGQNSLSAFAILACSMAAMGAVMLICAAKSRLDSLKNK